MNISVITATNMLILCGVNLVGEKQTNEELMIQPHKINLRMEHLFNLNMVYQPGRNNYETGKLRRRLSMMICGRFGFIAPALIQNTYGISHRACLEHLSNLVKDGLLELVKTGRCIDGRVYVLTYSGAQYASDCVEYDLPFRSQRDPILQLNINTISHDAMAAYVLLKGANEMDKSGEARPMWNGFITEREFARLYPSKEIRNVDGLVRENDEHSTLVAVEIEASFKTRLQRQVILEKYLHSLQAQVYKKVFMFSQRQTIFDDAKRLHDKIFETNLVKSPRGNAKHWTHEEIEQLKRSVIFRTKYCKELQNTFYR